MSEMSKIIDAHLRKHSVLRNTMTMLYSGPEASDFIRAPLRAWVARSITLTSDPLEVRANLRRDKWLNVDFFNHTISGCGEMSCSDITAQLLDWENAMWIKMAWLASADAVDDPQPEMDLALGTIVVSTTKPDAVKQHLGLVDAEVTDGHNVVGILPDAQALGRRHKSYGRVAVLNALDSNGQIMFPEDGMFLVADALNHGCYEARKPELYYTTDVLLHRIAAVINNTQSVRWQQFK